MFSLVPIRYAAAAGLAVASALLASDPDDLSVGDPGGPARDLTLEESKSWRAGRTLFQRAWRESDGLGAPGFNAESCAKCHNAPAVGGAGANEFNVIRLSGQAHYEPDQRAGNALARLRQVREAVEKHDEGQRFLDFFEEVQTPSLLGLGAIDTIPDAEILRHADPDDSDGDGIRGIARRVRVPTATGEPPLKEVGRFGWKAQMPRVADFVCLALGGETGITAPDQGRGFGLIEDPDAVADPEISQSQLDQLVFFVSTLATPKRAGAELDYNVKLGRELFTRMRCAACHVPTLQGSDGPVALYSDLLLHEVAPEPEQRQAKVRPLTHHFVRPPIETKEPEPAGFRTPPLWGVGATAPYMHDGTAATLRDAIRAHHGEASWSREQFERTDEPDQNALILFLEDL